MKATSQAFALVGYLPIPKFLNVSATVQAALLARVYHESVETITTRLAHAEYNGHTMPDPDGNMRTCHTPLISHISDLPEQRMISCVLQSHSPTSIATLAQFGDFVQQPPRTRAHQLGLFAQVHTRMRLAPDPQSIPAFVKEAARFGLLGVARPFWLEWGNADPSEFLTPDALHAWHKFFFDHVLKWVINIMEGGGAELDRRMAALQKMVGVRHWPLGISKLKQCTGREHRDLEKIIVAVIAGAVPRRVLCAVRAINEFFFNAQGLLLYDEHFHAMDENLREFHTYKNDIIHAGGRRGKHGPLPHFNIPKLEGMGRVGYNARKMGASYQHTSDITERCHIILVKEPYRHSNRREYHEQCARWLDRKEKAEQFQLYTALAGPGESLLNIMVS